MIKQQEIGDIEDPPHPLRIGFKVFQTIFGVVVPENVGNNPKIPCFDKLIA